MSEIETQKILKGIEGQPDTFWDDKSKIEPVVDKKENKEETHEYHSI